MDHTVYLGLGSNLGDRRANLLAALGSLPPALKVLQPSSVYETPPWGYKDQPPFLNQVLKAATDLSPADLLAFLKQVETQIGRVPSFRNGPREIDIDILLYDDLVLDTPRLAIPHPRLAQRAFMLLPLCEIAPQVVHPGLHRTAAQLLAGLETDGIETYEAVAP